MTVNAKPPVSPIPTAALVSVRLSTFHDVKPGMNKRTLLKCCPSVAGATSAASDSHSVPIPAATDVCLGPGVVVNRTVGDPLTLP